MGDPEVKSGLGNFSNLLFANETVDALIPLKLSPFWKEVILLFEKSTLFITYTEPASKMSGTTSNSLFENPNVSTSLVNAQKSSGIVLILL